VADNSAIEWTDATWNPVTGCTKVSAGCDHCYAETFAERWRGIPGHHFENGFDVTLRPDRLDQPLRWKRPRRIFVNSMSDLFHDDVPDMFITRVFDVMEEAKHHTFQVLTKRHARMRSFVKAREQRLVDYAEKFDHCPTEAMRNSPAAKWARQRAVTPPANIWLGVSVEDQKWADIRVPALLDTPVAVRFLSCEPLLGPVNIWRWIEGADPDAECLTCGTEEFSDADGHPVLNEENGQTGEWCDGPIRPYNRNLHWVIVGGESGHGARPMHPDWARGLRDQSTAAGVPFLFKQWGGRTPKAGGRELDGRTWDEYPQPRAEAVRV
jgi:protein gp37